MDLGKAQDMVRQQPRTLTHQEIRGELAEAHAEHPQRSALAALAMDTIEHAVAQLASLGHRFKLVRETELGEVEAFPMMVYRADETLTVNDKIELKSAKSDGWSEIQPAPRQSA